MGIRSAYTSPVVLSPFSYIRFVSVLLLLQFTCLITTATSSSTQRIAQGQLTTPGQYPSTLSLGLSSWAGIHHLHQCAGSILTESWVITAARCVEDAVEDVGRYYWLAGTNNLRRKGALHFISEIIIHPDYDAGNSFLHDIALVKVKHPFEFSDRVQPLKLSANTSAGTSGVVVGWGQVSQTLIQPDVLREANVTIIDVGICREIYAPWSRTIQEEFQFCAITAVDQNFKDVRVEIDDRDDRIDARLLLDRSACRGDQGGPIFLRDQNLPLTAGFVSWTFGCNPSGYPTVYTNIFAYYDWISRSTGFWI